MQAKDLVVLKVSENVMFETETFRTNINYRCCRLTENNVTQYLVFGIVFDEETFNRLFETTHERMIRDFTEMGLIKSNGKPVSKSKFSQIASHHNYGSGSRKLGVWYVNKNSNFIYGFYPYQGNKQEQLKECYEYFLDILKGEMDSVDSDDVCFGNCGIPIYYKKLRVQ